MFKQKMDNEQYLNPEAIYYMNRILQKIQISASLTTENIQVAPFVFSKKSRTWHFASVHKEAWYFSSSSELNENLIKKDFLIRALLTLIKLNKTGKKESDFEKLGGYLLDRHQYREAYEKTNNKLELCDKLDKEIDFNAFIKQIDELTFSNRLNTDFHLSDIDSDKWDKIAQGLGLIKNESYDIAECNDLIRSLLMVYFGSNRHRYQLLPGILFRNLESLENENIGWLEGMVDIHSTKLDDYETFKGAFHNFKANNDKIEPVDKEYNQYVYEWKNHSTEVNFHSMNERGINTANLLLKLFFTDFYSHEDALFFIVLPIYDTWLGTLGYGGIWGCLLFSFIDIEEKDEFKNTKLQKYRDNCQLLAAELTRSAMTTIASCEIKPPYDLIELFLKNIVHVQDWERIVVFRGNQPLYCYCREFRTDNGKIGDPTNDYDWKITNSAQCINEKNNDHCDFYKPQQSECIMITETKRILDWKKQGCEIWNKTLIPEIIAEESNRFGDISFTFIYPESIFVPEEADDRNQFELALVDQQIEVLRLLIPKVRWRRSLLRNAVVSIMGRNMSHNIGSHVLARTHLKLQDEEKEIKASASVEKFKQANLLFKYLQERMDFIADISTTDVFYSLPLYFNKDVIKGLTGGDDQEGKQELLLKHISGLDNVNVDISEENKDDEDFVFNSPGGRLGMQAFYIILENIARNTAKNGSQTWKKNIPILEGKTCDDGKMTYTFELERHSCDIEELVIQCDANITRDDNIWLQVGSTMCKRRNSQIVQELEKNKKMILTQENDILSELNKGKNQIVFPISLGKLNITVKYKVLLKVKIINNANSNFFEVLVWDTIGNAIVDNDNEGVTKKLYLSINDIIDSSAIDDETGKVNPKNWGIREMYLAAAYLRSISLENLESRNSEIRDFPVLEALSVSIKGEINVSGNLGYRFHLQKCKRLLVCTGSEGKSSQRISDPNRGIKRIEISKFKNFVQSRKASFYSYGIFNQKALEKLSIEQKFLLPIKRFIEEEDSNIDDDNLEEILAKKWWESIVSDRSNSSSQEDYKIYHVVKGHPLDSIIDYKEEGGILEVGAQGVYKELESNGKKIIVFDSHNNMCKSPLTKKKREDLEKLAFYEKYRAKSPQSALIIEKSEKYISLLKIAALTKIVILDERIQAHANKNRDFYDFCSLKGIFVPRKDDVDLDEVEEGREKLFTYLKIPAKKSKIKIDFLIIHQSIIDRLNSKGGDFISKLREYALQLGCEEHVIVCSGKGIPHNNFPNYARFLHISSILKWVVNSPSKLHLVNLLYQSRRP